MAARKFGTKFVNLEFLSKVFKNHVAKHCANDRNREICGREDLLNGECQALSVAICTRKLPHQKIGVEQEDYETDFNAKPPNRSELSGLFRV
jgi:hypothetical protein